MKLISSGLNVYTSQFVIKVSTALCRACQKYICCWSSVYFLVLFHVLAFDVVFVGFFVPVFHRCFFFLLVCVVLYIIELIYCMFVCRPRK